MNRYRVTWWQRFEGVTLEKVDLVLAYSAADAVVQSETAHKNRLISSEGDSFHSIRQVEPAPMPGWKCACGVTWSAPGPAICGACGTPSGPALTPEERPS